MEELRRMQLRGGDPAPGAPRLEPTMPSDNVVAAIADRRPLTKVRSCADVSEASLIET